MYQCGNYEVVFPKCRCGHPFGGLLVASTPYWMFLDWESAHYSENVSEPSEAPFWFIINVFFQELSSSLKVQKVTLGIPVTFVSLFILFRFSPNDGSRNGG